jgi:hypothetical protein
MVRMRWRSQAIAQLKNNTASAVPLLLAAMLLPAGHSQVLRQRDPGRTDCPDTHLRLTARHPDGSPAAGLRLQDLYLWFSLGSAEIRTLQSDEPEKTNVLDTNVLIVMRPQAVIDAGAADAVLRNLHTAASFHWKVAVLAADGSISPFLAGAEEAALRAALVHAVQAHAVQTEAGSGPATNSIADWTTAERNAFRQLQARGGRHVIVELAQPPVSPNGSSDAEADADGFAFAADRTLDLLARDDMAQIYPLTPAQAAKEQFEATGGRTAPTVDALFQAIIADAPGSYDLVLHPLFSCEPGTSYSLRITSFQPNLQLFYPSAIRMAKAGSH